ncbi:muskelin, partial [Hamiltosporidium tvaerminnensis]
MFTNRFLSHKIDYTIHSYSSYSSTYYPSNIKTDLPHDPTSRWSSSSNDQKQYLILELNKPTIVTSITFGKFSKIHVCNVKEIKVLSSPFRVDGGNNSKDTSNYFSKDSRDTSKDNNTSNTNTYHITNPNPNPNTWINNTNPNPNICINKDIFSLPFIEVLHTSLYNDTEKETFLLKVTNKNTFILTRYIKIIPLQAWGMNFNYSIWFIGLYGIDMCKCVIPLQLQYKQYQSVRLILKYLQRNEVKGFGDISRDSVRGDNDIGCDIKGDNNSTSDIKGDSIKDSDIKGNNYSTSDIKGDNDSTSDIKGDN